MQNHGTVALVRKNFSYRNQSTTSYLTESTTEAPTLLRSQVSTVYPTDSASRAGTRTVANTVATPEIVLPTHDARDLEIARLTNIAAALSQEKAQALTERPEGQMTDGST
eukprot:2230323-Amphidinium_carterae.5